MATEKSRARHFRYFKIFSRIIKNHFFAFFIKLKTYSAPVLCIKPTPSQINLIKNAKNNFLLLKIFKNTESAQLWKKAWAWKNDEMKSTLLSLACRHCTESVWECARVQNQLSTVAGAIRSPKLEFIHPRRKTTSFICALFQLPGASSWKMPNSVLNKPKRVNAPEGFNQVFPPVMRWVLIPWCTMMKFTSGCRPDVTWPARQQQEQSGQIQNKSEKNCTNLLRWRNKADKFRITLKKAWWNDPKYDEIPKFRGISPCSGPMLPFSTKADVFRHAFFKPCCIPFLFHHAFSEHFIILFPNPAVFFWILPFQASFTMLLPHISPWFILRCHFSLKPP